MKSLCCGIPIGGLGRWSLSRRWGGRGSGHSGTAAELNSLEEARTDGVRVFPASSRRETRDAERERLLHVESRVPPFKAAWFSIQLGFPTRRAIQAAKELCFRQHNTAFIRRRRPAQWLRRQNSC